MSTTRQRVSRRLKAIAGKAKRSRFDLAESIEQSMRDDFARAALMGGFRSFCADSTREVWLDYDDFAESCYRMAEAMLRERKKWDKAGRCIE